MLETLQDIITLFEIVSLTEIFEIRNQSIDTLFKILFALIEVVDASGALIEFVDDDLGL